MSVQDTLDFDPERLNIAHGQADTRPPPTDYTPLIGVAGIVLAVILLHATRGKWLPKFARHQRAIVSSCRRHCAGLLAVGLVILAADLTILRKAPRNSILYDAHATGWTAFVGAAIAIAALYFRLRVPPKI